MELQNSASNASQDYPPEEDTCNDRNVLPIGSTNRATSFPALQRRFANDPKMMKELQRYQNIMFLTLLPSISSQRSSSISGEQPSNLESSQQQSTDQTVASADAPLAMQSNSRRNSLKEIKSSLLEIKSSLQDTMNAFPNQERDHSRLVSGRGNRTNAGYSHFGAEQSSLVSLTANATMTAPLVSALRSRRKSNGEIVTPSMNKSLNAEEFAQHNAEHGNSNLDLTTLTALYLESRQRIFGEEWTRRRDKEHHSSKEAGEVGTTGIIKPRRLLPLKSESVPVTPLEIPRSKRPLPERRMSLAPPAPAGLHLSARFNHSLNFDDPTIIKSRKGSHKSRFRRLNSMDEFSVTGTEDGSIADSHRPSSAPHLQKKDTINEQDTFSLLQETPARANTPTGHKSSAHLIRPQLIGASFWTFSPDQSLNVSKKNFSVDAKNLPDSELLQKHSTDEPLKFVTPAVHSMRKSLPSKLLPTLPNEDSGIHSKPQLKSLSNSMGRVPKKGSRFKLSPLENVEKKHSVP